MLGRTEDVPVALNNIVGEFNISSAEATAADVCRYRYHVLLPDLGAAQRLTGFERSKMNMGYSIAPFKESFFEFGSQNRKPKYKSSSQKDDRNAYFM